MIAVAAMFSKARSAVTGAVRGSVALLLALMLGGCVLQPSRREPEGPPPGAVDGYFTLRDGTRLPYHDWRADGWVGTPPATVVLALHGFNDSRDAWEVPAPAFEAAGVELIAPDLPGFGDAPDRGRWPGVPAMMDDTRQMAEQLRARFPHARLVLMGESMGGAILMTLAASPDPPPVDGYVLVAPAVWSRAEMNLLLRSALWLASTLVPGMEVTGHEVPVHVRPTDNRAALVRLGQDPLTILATRFDTLRGLVNLMDAASSAAHLDRAPMLFLYGGRDDLVPPKATADMWRHLPPAAREAFYPGAYHLILRDLDRAVPTGDIIAWLHNLAAPLPSGADGAARAWLAEQP